MRLDVGNLSPGMEIFLIHSFIVLQQVCTLGGHQLE